MHGQYWVEVLGDVIVARLRGQPTVELLAKCHHDVVEIARESGKTRVLYDVLEMSPPGVDVPLAQRQIDAATPEIQLKRAIVVPNTRLAYLARLAFGDGAGAFRAHRCIASIQRTPRRTSSDRICPSRPIR